MAQYFGHFALVLAELTRDTVFGNAGTRLRAAYQRRLEFMRDVPQKARLVGIEFDQPEAQPVDADLVQVGKTLDDDGLIQAIFPKADDGGLKPRAALSQMPNASASTMANHRRNHLARQRRRGWTPACPADRGFATLWFAAPAGPWLC